MAKPSELPEWDTTGVNAVEPDQTHKDEGWLAPAGVPEKPPFQTFNHWMNAVWKWIKEFAQQGIVEWDGGTTYQIDDITKGSDGFLYASLQNTNLNKDPLSEPTWWSPLVSKTSGMKNILINGDKRVNQRAYAGGVLANGVYGFDRWKGADSDANIEQIIEQQNIVTGTYTISWNGGGTATVAGVSGLSSGDSVAITVAGDISVKVPKASTDIQLEPGAIATDFEVRNIEIEKSLCHRYYYKTTFSAISAHDLTGSTLSTEIARIYLPFNTKRANPAVTFTAITAYTSAGTEAVIVNANVNGCSFGGTAGAIRTITASSINIVAVDAEL